MVKGADPQQAAVALTADNRGKPQDCNWSARALHDLFGLPFGGFIAVHETLRLCKRSLGYRSDSFPGSAQRAEIDQTGVRAVQFAPPKHFAGATNVHLFPLLPAILEFRKGGAVNHRGNGRSVDALPQAQLYVRDVTNDNPQLGSVRCRVEAIEDRGQRRRVGRGANDRGETF